MAANNKKSQIRDYILLEIIKGNFKEGDPIFEKKFFTSKFKVNPSYVDDVIDELLAGGILTENEGSYIINTDEAEVYRLKQRYLNDYINEFLSKLDDIGISTDEAIRSLEMRNVANG